MASTAKLTIELPEDDFYRLQEESRKSGIRPEARVLELISRSFPPRRDDAFIALDRLRELRTGLPSVDSVELIRTVRDELEERPFR
jgi:hypothetical protein